MSLDARELVGFAAAAVLLVLASSGVAGLLRARRQARTERQALGEALSASEAVNAALGEEALFLSSILSAVDAVIVLFDRDHRVRFVNERFEQIFGLRGTEVVGRSRAQLVEAVAGCFREPEAFRLAAALASEERSSSQRGSRASLRPSGRASGIVAPDEAELDLERPTPRVLLFSQQPVVQGDVRIGVLAMFRDVTAQRAAEAARARLLAELEERATTDALTGVSNRRAGQDALIAEIERARRYERPLAVALFDLDHFKRVNDELGHEAGDEVLRAFAAVLRTSARSTDVVARWGGAEFLGVLPEADLDAAKGFAERVRGGLREAGSLDRIASDPRGSDRFVTCSAGVASLESDVGATADAQEIAGALVRRADEALYRAKREGRDRVRGNA